MRLLIYTRYFTPRIEYIFNTSLPAMGVSDFELIHNIDLYQQYAGPRLNYSDHRIADDELWSKPVTLLFEEDITQQNFEVFEVNSRSAFFKTDGDYAFDIFAASFYLITRYEEYLPHKLDMYGRYAHENSLAFQHNFLHLPLVNYWLKDFAALLSQRFPSIVIQPPAFKYLPTYDIDIAFSYKEKGFIRNAGGLVKSVIKNEWHSVKERLLTIASLATDPFDVYPWLKDLHTRYHLQPIYFFLLAHAAGKYDKNISPYSSSLKFLIEGIAEKNAVGIHPSWQSGDSKTLLLKEKTTLERICNKPIAQSRQHYIRMQMPGTYRALVASGITEDYSMGYGSINGFRASYCLPYRWYDLERNEIAKLTIFPFCYMEANSLFEQHDTPQKALEEMIQYFNVVKEVNGLLITVFHNHLITEQPSQIAWRKMYESFLQQAITS